MVAEYKGKSRLRNHKEEMFCQLYAELVNATQSAIRAGYGSTYASSAQIAKELRKREDIKARIDYLLAKQIKELDLGKKRRLEELKKIAFASPIDCIEITNKGTDFKFLVEELKKNGGAIQEITVQGGKSPKKSIKLYDKIKAIELIDRIENRDRLDRTKLDLDIESHIANMKGKEGIEQGAEVESDGFIEAMNNMAANIPEYDFIRTEGKSDNIDS